MTEAAYQNWIATYWIHSQRSTGSANPKNEKSPRFVLSSGIAIFWSICWIVDPLDGWSIINWIVDSLDHVHRWIKVDFIIEDPGGLGVVFVDRSTLRSPAVGVALGLAQ